MISTMDQPPDWDKEKHHPSCSPHDRVLEWHCWQCGANESAEAWHDAAIAAERNDAYEKGCKDTYDIIAERKHTVNQTEPQEWRQEDCSVWEGNIFVGRANTAFQAQHFIDAHNAALAAERELGKRMEAAAFAYGDAERTTKPCPDQPQEWTPEQQLWRSLSALRLEVPQSIADDILQIAQAALAAEREKRKKLSQLLEGVEIPFNLHAQIRELL